MKKYFLTLMLTLVFIAPLFSQIDRSKMPEAGPAPEIKAGKYESFQLPNGLKVFVVENHKLPRVTYSLIIDRDPISEGKQLGYISAAGELLRTGTTNRTKDQLDKEIDFIGGSISTSSSSIRASSLKKYTSEIMELMSDIILNANFTQIELDKIKKRMISNIKSSKDEPNAIANNVRKALVYGKDHPYGEIMTEETVNDIKLENCINYYKTFFKPNIAYLAVVGDITVDEAKELAEKYLSNWQKKEVPKFTYSTPKPPEKTFVALVDRANSVQSVVNVTYPVQLKHNDPDNIKAKVMNTILGGGVFRLFNNLREKHAYTYGAYSTLADDELVGYFGAFASVRNEVTDSSITQILYELNRIKNEKVSDDELQTVKNYLTGNYAISLENPQTVANQAINIARFNLPKDYYENYLKNISKVTADDIKEAAQKFIQPEHSYILVVGNADEIKDGLKKFGEINFYDMYGNKVDTTKSASLTGVTAQQVIDKYIAAIGGKEKFAAVTDRKTVMHGEVQGMKINMKIYQKAPDKLKQELDAGVMKQSVIFDGQKAVMSFAGNQREVTGSELEKLKYESTMDLLLNLDAYKIKTNLKGTEKVNGKDAYRIEFVLPDGTKWTQYYDVDSGLKVKESKNITVPQGNFTQETVYSDYREVNGVKYPFKINQSMGPQSMEFTVDSIQTNIGLSDREFEIK